jgi:transcription initiation factor TFIIH subunit 2
MPPRRINDDYMDGDSDSEVSIFDDERGVREKGKGKGKAVDGRKADKGKGKVKEVCPAIV